MGPAEAGVRAVDLDAHLRENPVGTTRSNGCSSLKCGLHRPTRRISGGRVSASKDTGSWQSSSMKAKAVAMNCRGLSRANGCAMLNVRVNHQAVGIDLRVFACRLSQVRSKAFWVR